MIVIQVTNKLLISFSPEEVLLEKIGVLTLFRMGGGGSKKALPTSFSPVTNVGVIPKTF